MEEKRMVRAEFACTYYSWKKFITLSWKDKYNEKGIFIHLPKFCIYLQQTNDADKNQKS